MGSRKLLIISWKHPLLKVVLPYSLSQTGQGHSVQSNTNWPLSTRRKPNLRISNSPSNQQKHIAKKQLVHHHRIVCHQSIAIKRTGLEAIQIQIQKPNSWTVTGPHCWAANRTGGPDLGWVAAWWRRPHPSSRFARPRRRRRGRFWRGWSRLAKIN